MNFPCSLRLSAPCFGVVLRIYLFVPGQHIESCHKPKAMFIIFSKHSTETTVCHKKGDNVLIAKSEPGELCPVQCVKTYLTTANILDSSNDFLPRSVYISKTPKSYQLSKGNHVSYTIASEVFLSKLKVIGCDCLQLLPVCIQFWLRNNDLGGVFVRKKYGRCRSDICKDMYTRVNMPGICKIYIYY